MPELTLQRLRQMGGEAVLKKYGKEHFKKLGETTLKKYGKEHFRKLNKKSQASKKAKKLLASQES